MSDSAPRAVTTTRAPHAAASGATLPNPSARDVTSTTPPDAATAR
jgi:hypothetical protein